MKVEKEKLNDLRIQIDRIDQEIVSLIAKRFAIGGKIGFLKQECNFAINSPKREQEVIVNICKIAKDKKIPVQFVKKIFADIIKQTKIVQHKS